MTNRYEYWVSMERDGTVVQCYTLEDEDYRRASWWLRPVGARGYAMNGRCMAHSKEEAIAFADKARLTKITNGTWPSKPRGGAVKITNA